MVDRSVPSVRNKEIIRRILEMGEAQITLAREYGISRERVRQIYTRWANNTGAKSYRSLKEIRKATEASELRKRLIETVKFNCRTCGKPVYVISRRKVYCSTLCGTFNRRRREVKICDFCDDEYHPHATAKYVSKWGMNFCKAKHYHKYQHLLKKSYIAHRLKKKTWQLRESRKTIERLKDKIETLKYQIVLPQDSKVKKAIKPIIPITIDKPVVKEGSIVTRRKRTTLYGAGKCKKCGVLTADEYEENKSNIDPNLCNVCDESGTKKYEGYSLVQPVSFK